MTKHYRRNLFMAIIFAMTCLLLLPESAHAGGGGTSVALALNDDQVETIMIVQFEAIHGESSLV